MLILNPYESERSKCLWMLTLLHPTGLLSPMCQVDSHLRSFLLGSFFFLEEGSFSRKPKKLACTMFCSLSNFRSVFKYPSLIILPRIYSFIPSPSLFFLFSLLSPFILSTRSQMAPQNKGSFLEDCGPCRLLWALSAGSHWAARNAWGLDVKCQVVESKAGVCVSKGSFPPATCNS